MEALYSLLSDSPLFYSYGNFRRVLVQAYRQAARSIEALSIADDDGPLRNTEIYLVQDVRGISAFAAPPDDRFGPLGRTKHLKIPIHEQSRISVSLSEMKAILSGVAGSLHIDCGRLNGIPSFLILLLNVVGFTPSNSAAPPGPWIFPFVRTRVRRIRSEIASSRV